jgi:3-isopropylmalate/(R)-2-methylmalate dehydratase large subunit
MPANPEVQTLVDKIWDRHVITELSDGRALLHIDRHFLHDGTSRQAFDAMRRMQRKVHSPNLTFAVVDHIVSTLPGRTGESHPPGRERIHVLRDNCREFALELYDVDSPRQGIAHVIAPELGITLPRCTLVCGDSHTATNGGLGALAFGIGTTEVMHVIATQALLKRKPPQMRISFSGRIGPGVYAKDLILYFIARRGVTAGSGYAVEYAGSAIRSLPVEARCCSRTGVTGSTAARSPNSYSIGHHSATARSSSAARISAAAARANVRCGL